MSMMRPILRLAALAAVLNLATCAWAQGYSPFIDAGYFEPDMQFFAPAEVGDFSGPEKPNYGFYATYDKPYLNVSRPDGVLSLFSETAGDFTWGNRYELGYMTGDPTGWQVVMLHIGGPNEYVHTFQERINRFNTADGEPPFDPIVQDRNPRFYDIRQSINAAKLSSFELNKNWRNKEFHNGTVLEPLIGFRYMTFKDFYRNDNYVRFDADAGGEPIFPPSTVDGRFEALTTDGAVFTNTMLGGQLGARIFNQRGHWLLSADFRFFACQNFQLLETNHTVTITRYTAAAGAGDTVQLELVTARDRLYAHNQEFVFGGEVRAEAAYELTRDISLRFGLDFLDLGQGIGRGNLITGDGNRQDVQLAGITFGFTVNR
jgi:hypothetical protein